jgi:hypothetical protein
MLKFKITALLSLCTFLNLFSQTLVELTKDNALYAKLEDDKLVFYIPKDSIEFKKTELKSSFDALLVGKNSAWSGNNGGIINLSLYAARTARKKGYDGISVAYYRGTSKNDTLAVTFYKFSETKITDLYRQSKVKKLVIINPLENSEKDAVIDGEPMTFTKGGVFRKEVKSESVKVRLGHGLLSSTATLGYKNSTERYFLINGHKLTGAQGGGIGIGVSAPTIMEIFSVSGEIIINYLNPKEGKLK